MSYPVVEKPKASKRLSRVLASLLACGLASVLAGCAALSNPNVGGIPVRRLPPELLGAPREKLRTIPLTALRQDPPRQYRLGPGDVLGIYIEGVLPMNSPTQPPSNPPVYFPSQYSPLARAYPPAMGFPIQIRDDGSITLPLSVKINVNGMDISQAEDAIRNAYFSREILQPGRERIVVTLMQPRTVRVVVMRQETGGFFSGQTGLIATSATKRGTGHVIDLPMYQNDVLTAIGFTGGLPGLDDYNQVFIFKGNQAAANAVQQTPAEIPYFNPLETPSCYAKVVTIPLRMRPGEPLPFSPQDVVLEPGDVILLEARVIELYYTAGLLPTGEQLLPRDYDLDVVEAIAQVKGPLINGAFGGSNLSGSIINPRAVGNPNPSLLTVIRRTPNGGQVAIRVDLNRALHDDRERILVQPSDVLILQETPGEALTRYAAQMFNLNITSQIIQTSRTTGTATGSGP